MIHVSSKSNENHGYGPKKKPVKFLFNLFKRKKTVEDKSCVNIESPIFTAMEREPGPGRPNLLLLFVLIKCMAVR